MAWNDPDYKLLAFVVNANGKYSVDELTVQWLSNDYIAQCLFHSACDGNITDRIQLSIRSHLSSYSKGLYKAGEQANWRII